jgi:hypothetical protein
MTGPVKYLTLEFIRETIQNTLPGKEGEYMAERIVKTLYDEIYEKGERNGVSKGMEKGILKGIEIGIKKGQADVLLKQLEKRFGTVHVDVREKLYAKQDLIVLDSLAVQLLDCESLEEFIDLL